MGLFDYVECDGTEFVCSEGHSLVSEEFQTKDLGKSMGRWHIATTLTGEPGGCQMADEWPAERYRALTATLNVYCSCTKCPAFLQAVSANVIDVWCEFDVELVAGVVKTVRRVSESTADFLAKASTRDYLKGAEGPMPYADACRRQKEVRGF